MPAYELNLTMKKNVDIEIRRVARDIKRIRDAGWAIYGMDDTLYALSPDGVKIVGDGSLPDSPAAARDELKRICHIDDSGGW